MTGFSATWLALREPADRRARNSAVLAATARLFADRQSLDILDLGSGTGSNLRGCAQGLSMNQRWCLVDYDPDLIRAASAALADWAGEPFARDAGGCSLRKGARSIAVRFRQADLATELEEILATPTDLVTAAAFFDLVSADWIARFAEGLAKRRLPLYTALIYNGQESWEPPHPADADVTRAFHIHQGGDKGFGPAAGPVAAALLTDALRAHGYDVLTGESPWRLTAADGALIAPLADGIAQAARETGRVDPSKIASWRDFHRQTVSCTIGHTDLLAIPPGTPGQRRP